MLALIAGTGDLPPALLARLPVRPLICALAGFPPQITPDLTFRIEHLGSFLADLAARGVTDICMAGAVKRPPIDPAQIDAATTPLVAKLQAAMGKGDDGALRGVIAMLENAGFNIIAVHELAPDLLPAPGILAGAVSPQIRLDAVLGEQTIAAMGRADVGQACIVQQGRVIAREDAQGTDAMIARFAPGDDPLWGAVDAMGSLLGGAAEWLSGADGAPIDARGAVLFKAPKPDQDRRADLPVIGPQTARGAVAAGLAGIVVEAGGVIVLNPDQITDILGRAGACFWVRPKGGA
ncbi:MULTISPECIES: LpxI family protein [unclassified Yoonia]|uniref:LpxI family protein n=1 Tax=unclassified Yoonia TaxID=2629118 RepID=UPI002AFDF087|nr:MULTISPECIES: UDP-2,3-diacylglucosamine diphosphatase LpxI [unclassified Yoonia]